MVISTRTVPNTWGTTKASPSRLERESEIESIEGADVSNVEDKRVVVVTLLQERSPDVG